MLRRLRAYGRLTRLLHLRELRLHPLRTIISVISVAAGVAMILAVVIVVRSTTTSFEDQAAAIAGPAPLRVVGYTPAGGLGPSIAEQVQAIEGVAAATPMVRAVSHVERNHPDGGVSIGADVLILGIDCRTAAVIGTECGRLGASPLLSESLEADARAGAFLRADTGRLALDPSRSQPGFDQLGDNVAVFSLGAAQELLGRGASLDVVFVVPQDAVDVPDLQRRLRLELGPAISVLSITDQPAEFRQVLNTVIPLFGLIGIFALAIGMILVANTVALALEERRQKLAVVAAIGGTSTAVVGGALLQAALVGALGGLLGVLGAIALAYPLTASVSGFTLAIAGVAVEAHPSEAPIVAAMLGGAAVAVLAAWRPARRAGRSDVAAELTNRDRRSEADSSRLAPRALLVVAVGMAGAGLTAAAGANGSLDSWQPRLAPVALLATILGLSLGMARVTPLLAQMMLRGLGMWTDTSAPSPDGGRRRIPGLRGGTVRLALANLVREPARTGVMALAVGAAVGTAFMIASFNESAKAGITEGVTSSLSGKVALSIGGEDGDREVFARVPTEVVDAVRSRLDVAALRRSSFLYVSNGGFSMGVVGVEDATLDLPIYRGTADPERFAAGEVMVGAAVARAQDIEPGGSVTIPVGDGFADLPVQGIWADGNVVGNIVQMPRERFEELFGPRPADEIVLTPAPGVGSDRLAADIRAAGYDPALRAERGEALAERVAAGAGAQLAPFWALQRGLTVVAFIAALSTLLLVGIQRTREIGLLAAVGMEPRSIAAMVILEAVIVGVLGTLVGAVLSTGMNLAFYALTPLIIGWENPLRFAVWAVPLYGAVVVLAVALGAALPAWRAARVQVVEALAYE